MKKTAITISAIAIILLALITSSCSWGLLTFGESFSIKKDMEEYMRATYGKDFVVSKPHLVGGGWGRPATTYVSRDSYPVDDPGLKFDISWDTKERTYLNTYLAARWCKEGKLVMDKKLCEVYGEGNYFIRKYFSAWNDVEDQKFTWADVMKNRSERNRIDFSYFVFFDGDLDRKKEAERAYNILKENFINYKVRQYNFSVRFIYKDEKDQLINIYTDEKKSSQRDVDKLHKAGLMKDWIRVNYSTTQLEIGSKEVLHQEVKSAEDLYNTRFQIE